MSLRFHNLIRRSPEYRRNSFDAGMRACGHTESALSQCEVLLTWNRYGQNEIAANNVENRGGIVLCVENASWGNDFCGGKWYSIWLGLHNRRDRIKVGGAGRWDDLTFSLMPWRTIKGERVGLLQRGIGPAGVASPRGWQPSGVDRCRRHPGVNKVISLQDDLKNASEVHTWGSGAAIKALMWGIPVISHMPMWAGEQDNTDSGRLHMFRRLAWAQWRLSEIESGIPFRWLL